MTTDNPTLQSEKLEPCPKVTYTIVNSGVNDAGWWVFRVKNNRTGRVVEKSRKAVANLRREGRITP